MISLCGEKTCNQKYYGEVNIDSNVMNSLPDDKVLIEILSIIWHETDECTLDGNVQGYVPEYGKCKGE